MNKVKTVLITGASRGIGAAAAGLFAARGCNVVINYNKDAAAAKALRDALTKKNPRGLFEIYGCDVSDEGRVREMFDFVSKRFGCMDVLVNNAGIALPAGLFADETADAARRVIDVNLHGVFNTCRAALPVMTARGGGCIVNVSSVFGLRGAACEAVYGASKGALTAFTRAVAHEAGAADIRVNAVAPGLILTDMNRSLSAEEIGEFCKNTALRRPGEASEIAEVIYFLCSPAASYITGQTLVADGGYI